MDDVLKAYGQPRKFDTLLDVIDFDPELGFNPYFWLTRKWMIEDMQKPGVMAAYLRYKEAMKKVYTAEFMIGQAYGL
jgi:hypothetical protein